MKIAFITNICPHYRIKTFETLAKAIKVDYYFFSAGNEWYWQQQHGTNKGDFNYEYLSSIQLGGTRITPTLPGKLLSNKYDAYIKCINGRFALPITYLIARLKRKPFILWTGIWTRIQTRVHRFFFPLTRYIYRHADAIVVYGDHIKQYLISEGVSANRIFIAHHAVDNKAYNRDVSEKEKTVLRQKLGIAPNKKVMLYLGRLETGKGIKYLLEAFATLNRDDTVLIIAGTGSEQMNLQRLAQDLEIQSQTRFPGYIPTNETVPYYALAWVYVLPSVTTKTFREPWGLVVNEAFNQGTPVIATNAVGAAVGGLVQDGVNGFIVPEQDVQALSQRLEQVMGSADLRQGLSQNAKESIANWDNERMVVGFRRAVEFVQRGR